MARKLAFVLALMGLCLATAVYALGLGNIQSESALNEPLSATVPLMGVDEDEASSVKVDLASPEAFERAGIERPFSLSRLNFEVKQGAQGAYIEITTKQPVKEPFLDFLLEVRWPQGRLVREYTLLLDPPTYAPGDGAPSTQAPAVASDTAEQPAPADADEPSQPTTTGGATATGARSLGEVSEVAEPTVGQYTVEANDTLWEIARTVGADGSATINQTMLALFRENPDAFINGDMNRLKRGAVLRVPEGGEIGSIPVAEANAEVRRQIERWQRNRGVAGGSGTAGGDDGQQAAATETAGQESGGELRVVAPDEGTGEQPATSAQGEGGEASNRQVTLLRESNASLEAENEDLKAQVEALKREVAQLESRVNVETGEVLPSGEGEPEQTAAETQAPEVEIAADDEPAEESVAQAPETEAAGGEAQPEAAETEAEDTMAETEQAADTETAAEDGTQAQAGDDTQPEQPADTEQASEPEQTAESQAQAQPEPEPEPEEQAFKPTPIWQDPMVLGLGGAVILVLLLLVYMVMRRRGGDDEPAQDLSDEIARGFDDDSGADNLAAGFRGDDERGDDTFAGLDEEAPELPPESEPLSEAEVYLAYGRYDQAQDVLERGLQRDPDNKELRLKMLEVLALTQDRAAFEDQAEQLHARVDDDSDPAWQRALEMGREMAPEHPLFGASGAGAAGSGDDEDFGLDLTAGDEEQAGTRGAAAEEPDKAAASSDEFSDLDFSFEESVGDEPAEAGRSEGGEFDLDFNLDEEPQGGDREEPGEPGEPAAGLEELEFDLNEQSPENPASAAGAGGSEEQQDSGEDLSLDFDLDEDQPMASPARDEGEFTGSESEEDAESQGLEDFSFDFEEESEQASASTEADFEATTKDVDMQSTALDYNVEEPADTQSAGGAAYDVDMLEEVGTKLDLARAYMDMGDSEGARALLDEVVEEGNDAQIKEAQELLSQAG